MTQQPELFYESPEEALAQVVMCLGGFKAAGARLRPDLCADQAGNWLRDTLNPHKRDKLSPGQILLLLSEGRRAGCHSAMAYLCREAGYADPQPLEPQDERAALERAFVEAVAAQKAILARMERLASMTAPPGQAPSLRPVA